jgi:hypothetical protein
VDNIGKPHRDEKNYDNSTVFMVYFKKDGVDGGFTVFPELGFKVRCSNHGLIIFDGKLYQHYVEEIQNAIHENWNRCSLVLVTTYFSPLEYRATLNPEIREGQTKAIRDATMARELLKLQFMQLDAFCEKEKVERVKRELIAAETRLKTLKKKNKKKKSY